MTFIQPDKRVIISKVEFEVYDRTQLEQYLGSTTDLAPWDLLRGDPYHFPFNLENLRLAFNRSEVDESATALLAQFIRLQRICLLDGLGRLSLSDNGRPGH